MGEKVKTNLTEEKNKEKQEVEKKVEEQKETITLKKQEEANSLKKQKKLKKKKEKNNKRKKAEETSMEVVKKPFSIMGIPVVKLFAFFVIFSVLGFFIETLFALITKGVIESRKSFLYGPFCAIYGMGASVMIVGLQKFKKNNYTLFFGGCLIGSIVEYIVSWIGEIVFDIKWWDYSNMPFNINGRVCILFSVFWGALAIYLMNHVYPKMDKFLSIFSFKTLKKITTVIVIFMLFDWLISSFAVKIFSARVVYENNVEVKEINRYIEDYNKFYSNDIVKKLSNTLFSDEIMLKSFPNLKLTGKDGNIILISDILTDIQPYYVKVFNPTNIYSHDKIYEIFNF